ncbi:amidohydrolase family protein [Pseudonocardia thermophila]|uniref:amidohydrolase family protein n=1 Tax=Pseudonocardia thermophila TaxID=1848 RepID=UPI00248DB17B|nr:amidohydrolase family protein [Pseudonocardia thermophila]
MDADVHESLRSINDLMPYLDAPWQRYITECRFTGIPGDPYVATAHGGRRADSWPADGGPPGSDYDLVRQHVFDEHNIDYLILTGHFYRLSTMPQSDFAVALMSAYNDWLIDTWLARDSRIYGSLQVALQDPAATAREIDRLGSHPQIVQIVLPCVAQLALGHPAYHPVYEAAVRNGLAVAVHPSSFSGSAASAALVGSHPRTYLEYHQNFALAYQAQLTNLVLEGVLDRFPEMRLVLLEGGFTWVPHLMWTLDAHWRSLQLEVPWLRRRPSEYILEQVTFGTQPVVVPDDVEHLIQVVQMFDGQDRLLFATDYPHWDFDSPTQFLPASVPTEWRRRILGSNALQLYGLPQPAEPAEAASARRAAP